MPQTSITVSTVMPVDATSLGAIANAVAATGAGLGAVTPARPAGDRHSRDIEVLVRDAAHAQQVLDAIAAVPGTRVSDHRSADLLAREGGVIAMHSRVPLTDRDGLSMAYTPGVARVCMAIHHDFDQAWTYTIKANSVMVVSDGTDVAGQGALGAEASLPACEAVCLVLNAGAGIDAFPLPVDAESVEDVVNTVARCSSVFAGIHLTSIAADRAEAIRTALAERIDIPVRVGGEDAPGFAAEWRTAIDAARAAAGV